MNIRGLLTQRPYQRTALLFAAVGILEIIETFFLRNDALRIGLFLIDVGLIIFLFFYIYRTREHKETSETNFRRIFDSNLIGYVIGDNQGNLVEANDYFLGMLGVSRAEMQKGISWISFTPEEYRDISQKALQEVEAFGVAKPFEKEYVRRDGTRVWALVGATRHKDLTMSYILNISDRKQAERELAEAKGRLEENVNLRTRELLDANRELSDTQNFLNSVIENLPNMVFVKDAEDLRFIRLNRAGEQLLGHSRLDLLGKNDYDFFPADQADFFTAKDREVLAGGCEVDIPDEPITTRNGPRFLHTKKIPILDKSGNPLYLLGISEDITERKESEKQRLELVQVQAARSAAERSNKRLSFLSEASAALNESLDIRSVLNSFSRVIVENMADWCVVDLYDRHDDSVDRIVAAGGNNHVPMDVKEWWQKAKFDINDSQGIGYVIRTGKSRVYNDLSRAGVEKLYSDPALVEKILSWGITSSMVVPLSYHGHVMGTLCFVLTNSRQQYDDFDLSIAQDLAKRAALAIENARLFTKANEASRAKSAFLANISHEIRTPLGAMLGFAELVLDDQNLNSQQKAYISTIARNGRQLLRLVDEILDLSKVESDRIQIEQLAFNLPALLKEVHSLMQVKADEKDLALTMRTDHLPERVKTDPLRLRQILFNVIGNAIKFTEKGTIRIDAKFVGESGNSRKGTLEINVRDTGIGMSECQTAKVFQPFVQGDGSMSRKYGGTGLGLFLSRKLARLLGGDVILRKSTLGGGSEFTISVSVHLDQEKAAKPAGDGAARPEPQSNAPLKVLLVDDSPDNRMLISAFLTNPGINLDVAENGARGVEKAMHKPYDIVLMDIQMPEMDGFDAIKELSERGYKGPVVALTAHAMKGDRERCLRAGFSDYLCKPVSRQSLMDLLHRFAGSPGPSATIH